MGSNKQMSPRQQQAFMVVWMLMFFFFVAYAIEEKPDDKLAQIWMTFFFLGAGSIWYYFAKTLPKWVIALLEIAVGSVSNYHQLT